MRTSRSAFLLPLYATLLLGACSGGGPAQPDSDPPVQPPALPASLSDHIVFTSNRDGFGLWAVQPDGSGIVGELPFPVLGQSLGMVGRTTGLTGGPVNLTCVTLQYPVPGNFALFCQDLVRISAAGGDSGAPVGQAVDPLTGRINLAGLLWGGSSFEGGSIIFSAVWNIREDIPGGWTTH